MDPRLRAHHPAQHMPNCRRTTVNLMATHDHSRMSAEDRTHRPTDPEANTRHPKDPEATTRRPTDLEASIRRPTDLEASTRRPTDPEASTHRPTDLEASTRRPTDPEASTHRLTDLEVSTHRQTDPEASMRRPTDPEANTHHQTNPVANIHPPTDRRSIQAAEDPIPVTDEEDINIPAVKEVCPIQVKGDSTTTTRDQQDEVAPQRPEDSSLQIRENAPMQVAPRDSTPKTGVLARLTEDSTEEPAVLTDTHHEEATILKWDTRTQLQRRPTSTTPPEEQDTHHRSTSMQPHRPECLMDSHKKSVPAAVPQVSAQDPSGRTSSKHKIVCSFLHYIYFY